ncbi:MAG: hypothetical protein AAF366_13890 [Pseudomonadota bacterium]
MARHSKAPKAIGSATGDPAGRPDSILAVGLTKGQTESLPSLLFGALGTAAVVADFADLTRDRLWSTMAVLSPLVATEFDAVEMAGHLAVEDFKGRYYAFSSNLPDGSIVREEVSAVAPDLSFELINLSPNLSVVPNVALRS